MELKAALTEEEEILDDAATPDQLNDLHMIDGIQLIVRSVDECWTPQQNLGDEHCSIIINDILNEGTSDFTSLNKVRFEAYINHVIRNIKRKRGELSEEVLSMIRLFSEEIVDFDANESILKDDLKADTDIDRPNNLPIQEAFDTCTNYYRYLLVESAAECLLSSWDELTQYTSSDIDRAAVAGDGTKGESIRELSREKVDEVLRSYFEKNCSERVEAFWKLIDHDEDGLVDQEEMDKIAHFSITPVQGAVKKIIETAVDGIQMLQETSRKSGWRQRRKESKKKKSFKKLLSIAVERHFDIEVEMHHRLRCIYAWANKAHQEGKVDSVLIEAGTIAGRKRYVELNPKISYKEFSSVKEEIFQQLDRVSEEIVSSFREDILVSQGKGRQNKELFRECAVGVGVMTICDAGICML